VTNELVNRVGISFVHEAKEKTGMSGPDVVRAYVIAREVFRMRDLWAGIEALDNRVPATAQARMLAECGRLLGRGCLWFLTQSEHPLRIRHEIEANASGVAAFREGLESQMSLSDQRSLEAAAEAFVTEGVPADVAREVASLPYLTPACDNVRLARATGVPVRTVASLYFAVGGRFGFDWLRSAASRLSTDAVWDKLAVSALEDDLYGTQCAVSERVLGHMQGDVAVEQAIQAWCAGRPHLVTRTDQLLAELKSSGAPQFPMLAVANRQLKAMSI
jgi:glutamate dehydrogenase